MAVAGADEGMDPTRWFDGSSFVPARLGADLKELRPLRPGVGGVLHHFEDGVWRSDGAYWVAEQVRNLLNDRFQKRRLDETLAWLRSEIPTDFGKHARTTSINCSNGSLYWEDAILSDHTPDQLSRIRIPVKWNPDATCPTVDQYLRDVLPEDCVGLFLELLGYLLIPSNQFQLAVLLLGQGGTSKTTALRLMRSLLGADNVSSMSLHRMVEDRFASAELYGKLANISGDLDARSVERSDIFKMVTGGDSLTAERKYSDPFSFVPFARLIFAANEAPMSTDQSSAYFDRWLVIPMERRFRGTDSDIPDFADKLTTTAELEGLLVKAVAGLKRLTARGHFEVPASVREAGDRHQRDLDSVLSFVDEACSLDSVSWTHRGALYRRYSDWCVSNGRRKLSSRKVYDRLRGLPAVSETTRDGYAGFRGIAVCDEGIERTREGVEEAWNLR
jgi:putative DNA primase/helicase